MRPVLLGERVDAVSERREGLVDVPQLLELCFAGDVGVLADVPLFGSCEVDEVEFPAEDLSLCVDADLYKQLKDGVRP